MVVGEAPGREEEKTGRPFMGASGKKLREALARNGISGVFITNTVRCRPPENRKPTAAEMKACREYLDYEIARIKPKIVVALGATPTKALFKGKAKVSQHHGTIIEDSTKTYKGYVSYHPAAMLYDPGIEPAFNADIARLARTLKGELPKTDVKWSIVRRGNLRDFLREFWEANSFSFDLETSGLFQHDGQGWINCVGIGLKGRTWVIPLMAPGFYPWRKDPKSKKKHFYRGSPWSRGDAFLKLMKYLFWIARKTKKRGIAQNGKFDNLWLYRYAKGRFRISFDTMLASHTIDENRDHDLKSQARQYLDAPEYDLTTAEKKGNCDPFKLYQYNARDCGYTLRIAYDQRKELRAEPELWRLYFSLVMPAARAMEDIELEGKTLNMEKFEALALDLRSREIGLVAKLRKLIGHDINWDSPVQVRKLLYEDLGMKCTVFTKKGAKSTGENAIIDLKGKHPIIDAMIEYREVTKFYRTYVKGFRKLIVDDKLYISYKLHGTVTGRYSSRIHSIPRDGSVRNLVEAPPGWRFVQADISQAELRIIAQISNDLEMRRCFLGGVDIHWRTLFYALEAGYIGGGEAVELAIQTATMYCMQQEIPADGTSAEILSTLWNNSSSTASAVSLLEECREVGPDKATWSWKRRESMGKGQSLLERRNSADTFEEMEEAVLRALRQYEKLRRSSQGRGSEEQSKIQLRDALSLLSSLTPQQAETLDHRWKELRKRAKAIVFGYVYGMYEKKFIETAKTKYGWEPSYDEAHACREGYFQLYNELPNWHTKQKKLVKMNGFVRTMFGRRRRLPGIESKEKMKRMEAERQAINAPVQGTIGDWKAAVLVEAHETIDRTKFRLCGEHHDALLGLVKIGCEDETLPQLIQIIRKPKLLKEFKIHLDIPMDGEVEIGPWGARDNVKYVLPSERKAA